MKMFNLKLNNTKRENTLIVKKQKYKQEYIRGAYPIFNFFSLYERHEFKELLRIVVGSAPIYKVGPKTTISKDIDIKVLLDLGIEIPIMLPYFIKNIL
jgi:hypothetical protein